MASLDCPAGKPAGHFFACLESKRTFGSVISEGISGFTVICITAAMIDQRKTKTPAESAAGVIIVIWRRALYSSVTVV